MSSIKDPFVEIGAGKTVFCEGDAGAEMYVIESGQVELRSKARASSAAVVFGPGDFFGVDFLLDGKARSATATVKENVRLLRLTRSSLAEVIAQNPEIALGLLRRQLEQQVEKERYEQALLSNLASTAPERNAVEAPPAPTVRSVPPAPPAPASAAPSAPPEPAPAQP
ncbi:MAG: cyclic nucleotide-binding domain-containing protein, partial [Rudaea sp.]